MRLRFRSIPLPFHLETTKGGARLTKLMTWCQKSEAMDLRQEGSMPASCYCAEQLWRRCISKRFGLATLLWGSEQKVIVSLSFPFQSIFSLLSTCLSWLPLNFIALSYWETVLLWQLRSPIRSDLQRLPCLFQSTLKYSTQNYCTNHSREAPDQQEQ